MPLKITLSIVASDPVDPAKVMTVANNPTAGTLSIGAATIALASVGAAKRLIQQQLALDTSAEIEQTSATIDGLDPDGAGPAPRLPDLVVDTLQVDDVLSAVDIGVNVPASVGLTEAVVEALEVFEVLFPPPAPPAP